MCFSATGSFAAAGVLTTIGGVSIARHRSPRFVMLAALPLVFAAQQLTEGIVWLTMAGSPDASLHRFAVYAFLTCALIIWPSWVPIALLRAETQPRRRKTLRLLGWLGGLVSLYSASLLVHGEPAARIAGHSISYDYLSYGRLDGGLYLLFYLAATVLPFFISHLELAKWLGAASFLGLLASIIIQLGALASVWCFWSAILSGLLIASMELTRRRMDRTERVTA